MKTILLSILILTPLSIYSQVYNDYIGAGHTQNISISSSNGIGGNDLKSINGSGLDAKKMEMSRFLAQATLGFDEGMINDIIEKGIDPWIEEQLNLPPSLVEPQVLSIVEEIKQLWINNGLDIEEFFGPYSVHFNYAWWNVNMQNEDVLRHRVALALSEILVISANSTLENFGEGLGAYYDILVRHSFGNYKDLLTEVTFSPMMGFYLSHLNNEKTNLQNNTRPDQNYAREIMQLFSIGLYELNNDGTRKLDNQGNPIPTYTNMEIEEMSKIFTGLSGGALTEYAQMYEIDPFFGMNVFIIDKSTPMIMYEEYHEQGPKQLLNGFVVPDGQSGMEDILMAIDHLFNHPNVGPFISNQLIQRLIKSNPSPAYVGRIAAVFNDNGKGERGDLGAVIKAILLDDEARSCEWMQDASSGKLKEPLLRYTQVYRSLPKDSPLGHYWVNGYDFYNSTDQIALFAPSVFNFFTPDFQPNGDFVDAGLVAPEYQIHNSKTSIGYINSVYSWVIWESLSYSWEYDLGDPGISLIVDDLDVLSKDRPEELIHKLDILYTHGQLTDDTKQIIREAMAPLEWEDAGYWKTKLAMYLLLISPDFNVFK